MENFCWKQDNTDFFFENLIKFQVFFFLQKISQNTKNSSNNKDPRAAHHCKEMLFCVVFRGPSSTPKYDFQEIAAHSIILWSVLPIFSQILAGL